MHKFGILFGIFLGILAIAAGVFFFMRRNESPATDSIDISAVEETIVPETETPKE